MQININAKKTYGDRTVLDLTELRFDEGKKYALIGSNGSGKTTLLKIIAGLIKFDGKVSIPVKMQKSIGYLPQKSFSFDMSLLNNMLINHLASERKTYKKKAEEILEKFHLSHLKKKNATGLSGGETQRLALARLFMEEFEILLLDEPTASMDVNSIALTESAILDYCEIYRPTVIFATHSFAQARRLADEVIFLDEGICVERDAPEEIFDHPKSEKTKAFLNLFR